MTLRGLWVRSELKKRVWRALGSVPLNMGANLVSKQGDRKRLPIFEFFIRLSIGLRWICKYVFFKFWKLVILCIKYENSKSVEVQPCTPLKITVFSNSGSRTTFYLAIIDYVSWKRVLFRIGSLRRKTAGNVNRPGLSGVKRRFRHRLCWSMNGEMKNPVN